ncbi:solute carrier family 49 member 4-like [Amphiura filiformis]|uniref:solute carrier family 49 member 4-like n=1 Tax=Amphiura filiformis TaxID=82378 RepID=UPI003B221456
MGLQSSKQTDTEPRKANTLAPEDNRPLLKNTDDEEIIDNANIINSPSTHFRVYKRRFYVLAVYSVASIFQVIFWNTWSPIADTAMVVFGWSKGDIAFIAMWGGIVSAFLCIPFAGIMDKYGIRRMFLLAETFALIGVGIRCLPVGNDKVIWTANIGQFFIALAGPFLVQGPPLLSVTWFPPNQRTTATAVATISMEFGVALSFILGPLTVKEPKTINATTINNLTEFDTYMGNYYDDYDDLPPDIKQDHIDSIFRLLYIEFGMIVVLYIIAWIYFPSKPPTPPSVTASTPREDFLPGAKILVTSINAFWLPGLCYGISLGVFGTWASQLDIMFKGTVDVGQDIAGWIGFYTYIGGVVGGLTAGRCADYLGGKMKLVLLALTGPAIGIFVWFLLICYKVLQFNLPSLYVSATTYGFLLNAAKPLYLEVICEGVYPVAEGIAIGLLNWLSNCIGLMFLFVMMIPHIGVYWMNWTVLGSVIATFLILLVFKEHSKRLQLDKGSDTRAITIPTVPTEEYI